MTIILGWSTTLILLGPFCSFFISKIQEEFEIFVNMIVIKMQHIAMMCNILQVEYWMLCFFFSANNGVSFLCVNSFWRAIYAPEIVEFEILEWYVVDCYMIVIQLDTWRGGNENQSLDQHL